MAFKMRPYQAEDDYWRIRTFLRATFLLNDRRDLNWQAFRFDYWRWHVNANIVQASLEDLVTVWEMPGGEIAGVLNPEGAGEAFFQIHPHHGNLALEEQMLSVAEERLAQPRPEGGRKLHVWANANDTMRQELFASRGYTRLEFSEYARRRPLKDPIPDFHLPAGYTLRALAGDEELPARSWVSWRAFHPEEPDERYEGWEWYLNVQRAPLYRRDLDLVVAAPDGTFAGFCTVWFDDVTRCGGFEPVGVAPAHQRRGLGHALLTAGLQRVQWMGATQATVGSYSKEAGAFYESAEFTEYERNQAWIREW